METILSSLEFIFMASLLLWRLTSADTPNMTDCEPKQCGNSTISYPFWINDQQPSYCGYSTLEISCSSSGKPVLVQSYDSAYYIKQLFYQNNSALLGDNIVDIITGNCSTPQFNVSLSFGPFVISNTNKLMKFFWNCATTPKLSSDFYSYSCGTNKSYVQIQNYTQGDSEDNKINCSISTVPFLGSNGGTVNQYLSLMKEGFLVTWTVASCSDCKASNGQCGFNSSNSMFMCICADGTYAMTCPDNPKQGSRARLEAGLLGSLGGAFFLVMVFLIFFKLRRNYNTQENIEKLLEQYGSLAPRRYKYSELKKITKSFRDKLGKGGFGTVYKGKQPDGRMVAVKFLHNSTSNGEEFLNEVVSIGRTSHVNVVSLLGFCIEGSKRALVYEYMSNSEVYFPHWIYDRVAEGSKIEACDVTNETEEIARKMALVGFWCTQTIPANRPSMGRVVEMLERSLSELELPPKPYLQSVDAISVQSMDSTAPSSNSEPSDGLR
ncbi:putative receptor-like protein kinase [Carex littledalei]|uniref:Putative receptor-like protein kinase n=1 Tax=Carex littledalei TaxID=544730 RepID=A0A833R2D9_9POAL|nr:putative receptor-like protein kinase [Carex littledalei]